MNSNVPAASSVKSFTREITIQPVTRIEGQARIGIKLDENETPRSPRAYHGHARF